MGTILAYRQWTLWVGRPAADTSELSPQGLVALEQLRQGQILTCENGSRIECIRSDEEIFGYGIVLRRGSKATLCATDTVIGNDIPAVIAQARISLDEWFLSGERMVVEQDLANIRGIAA